MRLQGHQETGNPEQGFPVVSSGAAAVTVQPQHGAGAGGACSLRWGQSSPGGQGGQEPLALPRDPAEQLPAWLQGNLQLLVAKFCHVSTCGSSNRGVRVPRPLPCNAVTGAGRRVTLLGQVCAPAPSLGARCLSEHSMAGQGRGTRELGFTWLKYHHISLILDFS